MCLFPVFAVSCGEAAWHRSWCGAACVLCFLKVKPPRGAVSSVPAFDLPRCSRLLSSVLRRPVFESCPIMDPAHVPRRSPATCLSFQCFPTTHPRTVDLLICYLPISISALWTDHDLGQISLLLPPLTGTAVLGKGVAIRGLLPARDDGICRYPRHLISGSILWSSRRALHRPHRVSSYHDSAPSARLSFARPLCIAAPYAQREYIQEPL